MNPKVTTAEAAEILGQSIRQIGLHVKSGRLPAEKVAQHKKGAAPYRFEIKREDVMLLKEKLQTVKSGRPKTESSVSRGEDFTYMYHLRSKEHTAWLTTVLTPAERAAILDYYAHLKESEPEKFEQVLRNLSEGNRV